MIIKKCLIIIKSAPLLQPARYGSAAEEENEVTVFFIFDAHILSLILPY